MLFAITYRSGLKSVVLDEISEKVGQVKSVRTLVGARHHALIFSNGFNPAALLGLRSIENAFALAAEFEGIAVSKAGLDRIGGVIAGADFSAPLAAIAAARGGAITGPPRFVVTLNLLGKHKFAQREVHQLLTDRLQRDLGWQHDPDHHDVNVRLQVIRDKGFLGIGLSTGPTRPRTYLAATRPGSLDPTVAYCMARLTRPSEGEVFLDPLCGAGTIVLERALAWPAKSILCGDIAADAIAATIANAKAAGVVARVVQWDATDLPLADASVDSAAMNLPYGKDVAFAGDPEAFIGDVLEETSRVLRSGGRAVILTTHDRIIRRWTTRRHRLRLDDELPVELDGFDATIVVLSRR